MNKSITQFNWSNKTNNILFNLGIRTIDDFEGISIKALMSLDIPLKIITQIEHICNVHNIKTKETDLVIYTIEFEYEHTVKFSSYHNVSSKDRIRKHKRHTNLYKRTGRYIASNTDSIKEDVLQYCKENNYVFTNFKVIDIQLISDAYLIDDFKYEFIRTIDTN